MSAEAEGTLDCTPAAGLSLIGDWYRAERHAGRRHMAVAMAAMDLRDLLFQLRAARLEAAAERRAATMEVQ